MIKENERYNEGINITNIYSDPIKITEDTIKVILY